MVRLTGRRAGKRSWTLLVAALLVCAPTAAMATSKYDDDIDLFAKKYMRGPDAPLWLKAQLMQESSLNPNARSPVGAMGLGQFMPYTWREVCARLTLCHKSPYNPSASIEAAAYYQARQERAWTSPRPRWDRKALGLSGYNAGLGNILKAQKKCGGALRYRRIVACLPAITGHHSKETIQYVKRIDYYRRRLARKQ